MINPLKKIVLSVVFCFSIISVFAQSNESPRRLKYMTNAPDGTIALTIIDDSRENTMKLESANSFYKFQLINIETGEPVFSSLNRGKECTIDKSKVASGTYYLRLFTKDFVISSEITLYPKSIITEGRAVAFSE